MVTENDSEKILHFAQFLHCMLHSQSVQCHIGSECLQHHTGVQSHRRPLKVVELWIDPTSSGSEHLKLPPPLHCQMPWPHLSAASSYTFHS